MKIKALNCPNCGAPFQPEQKNCAYCGSYIIVSEENYVDLSNVAIHTEIKQPEKYPCCKSFFRACINWWQIAADHRKPVF